jgi:hypothetical protein
MRRLAAAAIALWAAGFGTLPSAAAQINRSFGVDADYSCGDTNPPLKFTSDDFRKGFERTYRFPPPSERCELGMEGKRGGTIKLTYRPDPLAPLVPDPLAPLVPQSESGDTWQLWAEVDYWEESDCRIYEDDPPRPVRGSFQWAGELRPTDSDPEGIFPAAIYEEANAQPTRMSFPGCTEGEPRDRTMDIRLVLVTQDPQTQAINRTPRLVLTGEFFGLSLTFGPVQGESGEEPRLAVEGCMDLKLGSFGDLTAKGEPAGGTYEWTAEPSSTFGIDAGDAQAIVTGKTPGRGRVSVRYQTQEGQTATQSVEGSVVDLRSVNGGAPLEVGVYDFDGKAGGAPARAFPTLQEPPDPGLLRFELDDPALVTIVNEGDGVMVQGQGRVGTTTAQAQTQCGESTGPLFTINVVPCDEETQARVDYYNHQLVKSEKEIADGMRQAVDRSKALRNDPEYKNALDSIKGNAINTATSIAEALMLGESYGGSISHVGHKLEKALTAYNVGRSAIKGAAFNDPVQEVLALMGVLPFVNLTAALTEIGIYGGRFADNASRIADTEDQLAELVKQTDFDAKRLYDLYQKHKRFCAGDAAGSKPAPSQPPAQRRAGSQSPSTPGPGPGPSGGGAEPGSPGAGTGGDQGEPGETISPPPPVTPPKPPTTGGFLLADCGCKSFQPSLWGTDIGGLQAIGADLRKTEACGTSFRSSLESVQSNVTALSTLPERLSRIATLPDQEAAPLLQGVVSEIDQGVKVLEVFRQDAANAKASLDSCGDQPRQAGDLVNQSGLSFEADTTEVIEEADRITVESLRTHY